MHHFRLAVYECWQRYTSMQPVSKWSSQNVNQVTFGWLPYLSTACPGWQMLCNLGPIASLSMVPRILSTSLPDLLTACLTCQAHTCLGALSLFSLLGVFLPLGTTYREALLEPLHLQQPHPPTQYTHVFLPLLCSVFPITLMLVSCGGRINGSQAKWLKTVEIYTLRLRGIRGPKSRCWQGCSA